MTLDRRAELQRALALHQAGRLEEALAIYGAMIASMPGDGEPIHLAGLLAHQLGRHEDAVALLDRALALAPTNMVARLNQIPVLLAAGKTQAARDRAHEAVTLDPSSAPAQFALGNAAEAGQDEAAAVAAYRACLALDGAHSDARFNLGRILQAQGDNAGAIPLYREALEHQPGFAKATSNLALALLAEGRLDEGEVVLAQALALNPGRADNRLAAGMLAKDRGHLEAAIGEFRAAIALDATHAAAHTCLGLALLTLGQFEEGWREYSWRRQMPDYRRVNRDFPQPLWQGEALAGRTLLIHAEQGLGDIIQFSRLLPAIADRGGKIILELPGAMLKLMAPLARYAGAVARGLPLPPFDLHLPLLELPRLLAIDAGNVPPPLDLRPADPKRRAAWHARLADLPRPRIGLVWRGSPHYPDDRNRSMALGDFAPLLETVAASWISLQPAETAKEIAAIGWQDRILDLSATADKDGAFLDSAMILDELDLLVSADTAPAHLAGTLGCPTALLLPFIGDWRWMQGRTDSPWYPKTRLYRQPQRGDWASVLAQLGRDLKASFDA